MHIYKICNRINDKVYIGLCKDIEQRWPNHIAMLRSGKSHHPLLQHDFNEYGDVYDFTIINEISEDIAEDTEDHFINMIPASQTLNIQKRRGVARRAFDRINRIRKNQCLNLT